MCIEPETLRADRIAQTGDDVDVVEAAHDTGIVGLVDLDAVAAAILGGLAGSFRRSQRM